jgi:hypothetical protein
VFWSVPCDFRVACQTRSWHPVLMQRALLLALVLASCGPTNLVVDPEFTAAKVEAWTIGTGLFDVKNGVARLEVTQAGFAAVASQKIAVEVGQEYNLTVRFGSGGAGIVAIGTTVEGTDVITLNKTNTSGDFVARSANVFVVLQTETSAIGDFVAIDFLDLHKK